VTDYEDTADHFDREHIPAELDDRDEIMAHMNQEFADETVPPKMKSAISDIVSRRRESEGGGDYIPDSGAYFDPSTGNYRSGDGGLFTEDPARED